MSRECALRDKSFLWRGCYALNPCTARGLHGKAAGDETPAFRQILGLNAQSLKIASSNQGEENASAARTWLERKHRNRRSPRTWSLKRSRWPGAASHRDRVFRAGPPRLMRTIAGAPLELSIRCKRRWGQGDVFGASGSRSRCHRFRVVRYRAGRHAIRKHGMPNPGPPPRLPRRALRNRAESTAVPPTAASGHHLRQ